MCRMYIKDVELEMGYNGAKGGDGFSHKGHVQSMRYAKYLEDLQLKEDAQQDDSKVDGWFMASRRWPNEPWQYEKDPSKIDSGKGILPCFWFHEWHPMQIVHINLMQNIVDEAGIDCGPIEFNGLWTGWRLCWYLDEWSKRQIKAIPYPSRQWDMMAHGRHLVMPDDFYPEGDVLAGRSRYGRRGLLSGWRCAEGHPMKGSQYTCYLRWCSEKRPYPNVGSSVELYSQEYNVRMQPKMASEHAKWKSHGKR